jgi:hypothetical protein
VKTVQLPFVFFVVVTREILKRLPVNWPAGSWWVLPYVIGGAASLGSSSGLRTLSSAHYSPG